MIRCVCLVQRGQKPDQLEATLKSALEAFCARSFGEIPKVNWIRIAPGSGFTAAQPSTSSIVSICAPQAVTQERRAELLGEICELWMDETRCSMNEIMAVVSDPRD